MTDVLAAASALAAAVGALYVAVKADVSARVKVVAGAAVVAFGVFAAAVSSGIK